MDNRVVGSRAGRNVDKDGRGENENSGGGWFRERVEGGEEVKSNW